MRRVCLLVLLAAATRATTRDDECVCPEVYEPVCGVDDATYSNACIATTCFNATIAYEGECDDECVCPKVYEPVCGDDGATYSNACFATTCFNVTIAYEGECCTPGDVDATEPCYPRECSDDGTWVVAVIDCLEETGVPCEGGVYVPPEPHECCSTCTRYGDVNGDSTVNIFDVVAVINMILNGLTTGAQQLVADVNVDQEIDIFDVVRIVGIILTPPGTAPPPPE